MKYRNFGTGEVGSQSFYSYNENNFVRTAPEKRPKKSPSEREALNRQQFKASSA
jgi:hypothetical protein